MPNYFGMITELDAINQVLSVAGDAPVTSVDSDYSQAIIARRMLSEISRELQSKGLWFNETLGQEIPPAVDGTINLPATTINAQALYDNGALVQRGLRFYDKVNKTYNIGEKVYADIIEQIPWDETPQVFRQLCVALAKSRYNTEYFGSPDVERVVQGDIQRFSLELQRKDVENRDINMLDNTRSGNIAFSNRR